MGSVWLVYIGANTRVAVWFWVACLQHTFNFDLQLVIVLHLEFQFFSQGCANKTHFYGQLTHTCFTLSLQQTFQIHGICSNLRAPKNKIHVMKLLPLIMVAEVSSKSLDPDITVFILLSIETSFRTDQDKRQISFNTGLCTTNVLCCKYACSAPLIEFI